MARRLNEQIMRLLKPVPKFYYIAIIGIVLHPISIKALLIH
jgi:hypothetical protein